MSNPPFAAQSAALTVLLATVASLVAELAKNKAFDPESFAASLDELIGRTPEEQSETGRLMVKAVADMMKHAAREGSAS